RPRPDGQGSRRAGDAPQDRGLQGRRPLGRRAPLGELRRAIAIFLPRLTREVSVAPPGVASLRDPPEGRLRATDGGGGGPRASTPPLPRFALPPARAGVGEWSPRPVNGAGRFSAIPRLPGPGARCGPSRRPAPRR